MEWSIAVRVYGENGSVTNKIAVDTMWTPERKNKKATSWLSSHNILIFLLKFGAGEGIGTLDPNLGKIGNSRYGCDPPGGFRHAVNPT